MKPETIIANGEESLETTKRVHKLIQAFQERIDHFKPNTAIAAFMEFSHDAVNHDLRLSKKSVEALCAMLSTMAPHIASEMLEALLHKKLEECSWPTYDPKLTAVEEVTIAIQVNGKLRGTITAPINAEDAAIDALARANITKWLEGNVVKKVIFVPNKLINYIV